MYEVRALNLQQDISEMFLESGNRITYITYVNSTNIYYRKFICFNRRKLVLFITLCYSFYNMWVYMLSGSACKMILFPEFWIILISRLKLL